MDITDSRPALASICRAEFEPKRWCGRANHLPQPIAAGPIAIAFLTRHRQPAEMVAEVMAGTNPGANRGERLQAGPLLSDLHADPAQEPGEGCRGSPCPARATRFSSTTQAHDLRKYTAFPA